MAKKIVETIPTSGFSLIRREDNGDLLGAVNCYPSCINTDWTVFDFYLVPNLILTDTKTEIFENVRDEEVLQMWERFMGWEI